MLLVGEINLDWLSSNSEELKHHCVDLNLTRLISSSTRPDTRNPEKSTLIDIILTNKPHKFTASGVFSLDLSDHCPIFCIRDTRQKKVPSNVIVKRDF